MQHTNSQRGSDGRFGASDGPKAKRVEVWLQPQTVELLDTLTRQWGVGRGKVIDQLLTRGPVPPQSWTEVAESPPPTPSASKATPEPEPIPTPEPVANPDSEPTPSGRGTIFDDPDYIAMKEEMSRRWDICKADAKVIGCKPERVQRFKADHKLPRDRPLSVDAQQLLRDELEAEQRAAKGEATALEARLKRLQERATPERLIKIGNALTPLPPTVDLAIAKVYLLEGLEAVGIKQRSKLVKGVWADLEQLIPNGDLFDYEVSVLPEDNAARRCLFWGAAIRLAATDGEPPADTAEFLDWCGYSVHQTEQDRQSNQYWSNFARTMSGKPSTRSDRQLLGLPEQGELTAAGIKSAFKTLARKHHPDAGGDASKFQRITDARDRLLLEAAG